MVQAKACVVIMLLLAAAATLVLADEPVEAPDVYIGMGYEWDFAGDDSGPDFEIKLGGRGSSPGFGLYDDKLLGAPSTWFGDPRQMKDLYGGAGIILVRGPLRRVRDVGTHLSRETEHNRTPRDGRPRCHLCRFNW